MGRARTAADPGRLPDFVVIGAPRAGTTALWAYLGGHPEVFLPYRKELDFFSSCEPTPEAVADYRRYFCGVGPEKRAGEASPNYLGSPDAARRMAATIPGARLVASLREPVARAWSHYWWRWCWNAESRSFEEAVADEMGGRAPEGTEYLALGEYRALLARFEDHFPREALLVTLLDDMAGDPSDVFAAVSRHIGIDPDVQPANVGDRVNSTVQARSELVRTATRAVQRRFDRDVRLLQLVRRLNARPFVPPRIDPDLDARLRRHFASANAALAEWLGRDLSAWA